MKTFQSCPLHTTVNVHYVHIYIYIYIYKYIVYINYIYIYIYIFRSYPSENTVSIRKTRR